MFIETPKIGRHVSKLSGYAPALPTPFGDDGRIGNPAPLKFALCYLGLMSGRLRLPLVDVGEATQAELVAVLSRFGAEFADVLVSRAPGLGHRGGP